MLIEFYSFFSRAQPNLYNPYFFQFLSKLLEGRGIVFECVTVAYVAPFMVPGILNVFCQVIFARMEEKTVR